MDNILKLIKEEDVKWVKLGEVSQFINGYAFKANLFREKGSPIIRITNIQNGAINFNDCKYINLNDYKNLENFLIKKGDILIAMSGATVGKIGYNFKEKEAYLNQRVGKIVPNENILNNKYLYYYLRFKEKTIANLTNSTGAQPNLNKSDIEKLMIPIPSLELQEKIVKILDTFTLYQEKIAKELEQRKKQYNYYKDMLLSQEYLLKKAKELCGKDASVQWQTLENVFNIVIGGDLPNNVSKEKTEENKIPILSNGKNEKAIYGYTNIAKYETESITISARGTIGWTNYISFPFYPIVRLIVLMPKIEINCKYAYYYLKSIEDKYNISKGGIPQLTKPMIINNKIPIPPLEVQEWIVNTLYPFYTISYDLKKGLTREIELRKKQYEYYREQLLDFNK